ncbi:KamA family radical SAM protein [Sphingobacterium lactis]|uniref:KamA family radical SAM protein n=2 Tax=Sphingobacterium TaxID=28453 RepID=UPI003EC783B8
MDETIVEDIKIVSEIYPFKTNNYVLDNLIDWENGIDDPIFRLNFPHKEMLTENDYDRLKWGRKNLSQAELSKLVNEIRLTLNPHPAGQTSFNVPFENGVKLEGLQHKYKNTVLYFPSHSQTCHAYCTFCFRWPQFVSNADLKFQSKELDSLVRYLNNNPQITDVLLTGGDPMVMGPKILARYIDTLIEVKSLRNVRIGTKSLAFWPYKFTAADDGCKEVLEILRKVTTSGKHLAIMAHFNHPAELKSDVLMEAIENLRAIGAEIRTQAPLLRTINNHSDTWAEMWDRQVQLGLIPYYMFLPRDTGAQHYFAEDLSTSLQIYRTAVQKLSGICRTAKGPVMSTLHGKVELLDIEDDVFYLRFLQHRDTRLTYKVFKGQASIANPKWLSDLAPMNSADQHYFEMEECIVEE